MGAGYYSRICGTCDMNFENCLGLGVAGNFAGHLEQAGEAADFARVKTLDDKAPKALFPFYLPRSENFLGCYPLSSDKILFPQTGDNLQIEPEVGVVFAISYLGDKVAGLSPLYFGAYNDCSIRRLGARKISEKKNWGPCSKGISQDLIPLESFTSGGILDRVRIASFLIRDGECFPYGVDSAARDYSYMYERLTDWMINRLNFQKDEGPAEDLNSYLVKCGRPDKCLVSIGATRYTPFGEKNYLQPGDESVVVLYMEDEHTREEVIKLVSEGKFSEIGGSVLRQKVVAQI